jgi:hypothetical protein
MQRCLKAEHNYKPDNLKTLETDKTIRYRYKRFRSGYAIRYRLASQLPIPVAVWSKAQVCGRLVAGIAGSNPARGMDVCLLCLDVLSCVGRGLGDGLITRPEESYRVSNSV